MPHGIETRLIEGITPMVRDLVTGYARSLPGLRYADVRVEVSEGKFAGAENGEAKSSGDDYAFAHAEPLFANPALDPGKGRAVVARHARARRRNGEKGLGSALSTQR